MQIRAAVVDAPKSSFTLSDIELEPPRPDEVLVRIIAAGVCRTDIHIRDREYPIPFPVIPGHEGVGVIEQTGTSVAGFAPGDQVIMSYPRCGRCTNCHAAKYPYCKHGFDLSFGGGRLDGSTAYSRPTAGREAVHGHIFQQSSFATHTVVPATSLVKVPTDLPPEVLAPLGCGIQTGVGAIFESLAVRPGTAVAILGTGGVGLSAVMAASLAGAEVIAVDPNAERRRLATELGATHALDPKAGTVSEQLRSLRPDGIDSILETTGSPQVLADGIEALSMTGVLAMVGAAPAGTRAPLDMNVLMNGRTVRGVIQGDSTPQIIIPRIIDLIRGGKFPVHKLVKTYRFDEINNAVTDMDNGTTIKPVLLIG
ncbi:aryl-alcohol dehydrogenase [Mycolicibacterium smegmatis MKD8]|uniref:Aryl-alcohol dehydrogenase n=1 Tax=Mycolicibacterium smegmatis (strain MKD8) TaxID=1214915 RepID=A0A2U9PI88_MYCSE|nr:aryl-alcohol dehydrogenase [Mycolicibacterium smegmatis MKD8]